MRRRSSFGPKPAEGTHSTDAGLRVRRLRPAALARHAYSGRSLRSARLFAKTARLCKREASARRAVARTRSGQSLRNTRLFAKTAGLCTRRLRPVALARHAYSGRSLQSARVAGLRRRKLRPADPLRDRRCRNRPAAEQRSLLRAVRRDTALRSGAEGCGLPRRSAISRHTEAAGCPLCCRRALADTAAPP